ncbi:MAG: Type 1 glutamine amidotransferase-like domain-containing protein [Candidatus Saccharimonadales bacterium]
MRLFLSSYRSGKHDAELRKFIGSIDKIAVITDAKDYKTPEDRKLKIEDNFNYYRSIGLEPTEVDLRPFFHKPGAEKLLSRHNFVWLAGGNVFLLRRALRYTGLDQYLGDAVRKNEFILGGESAGAIIMGPTLKYSETEENEDSPNYIPESYDKEVIWEGLNLVNYVPVPHYKTSDYIGIDEYIKNLEKEKIPYKTMTDDQAIIIDGFNEEFLA